jgi:hypothetical protein
VQLEQVSSMSIIKFSANVQSQVFLSTWQALFPKVGLLVCSSDS